MRLVDADAYKAEMKQRQDACAEWRDDAKADGNEELYARAEQALATFVEAKLTLDKMPTIDAVPVVRCRECAVPHNRWTGCPNLGGLVTPPDFYCADGERKDGDGDG